MTIEQKKLRQFRCNSCGGELELQNKRTRYVSCPYCGAVADAQSDAFNILGKNENPAKFPPRSFLKLGASGILNDKFYKIIGRTCWRSDYKEYWKEDGETGYSDEVWTFDEWLLIDEDGAYLMIIEDAEGYFYSNPLTPKYPSIPQDTIMPDFENGNPQRVNEYGKSEILYFEGESTYLVKPGRTVGFAQYSIIKLLGTNKSFISEWRYNDQGKIQEVEFFREAVADSDSLKFAFMSEEQKLDEFDKYKAKLKVRKTNKRIFVFGGLINLILGIVLSLHYSSEKSFEPVFNQSFMFQSYAGNNDNYTILSDSTKGVTANGKKHFIINPEDKQLFVTMSTTIEDEFQALFHLKILDSQNKPVFEKTTYAYNYRNYKNAGNAVAGGYFSKIFQLDSIKGEFSVQLVIEVPKNYNPVNSQRFVEAKVKIQKMGMVHGPGFFVFFGILMLFISLFIWKPKKTLLIKNLLNVYK